jgi:hypothetical protein
VLFAANLFALNGFYQWLFAAQCAWYLLAIAGGFVSRQDALNDAQSSPAPLQMQMKREGE